MPQVFDSRCGVATSRGIPGTLGTVAYTLHDGAPVLLSTWHVLFGDARSENPDVWLVDDAGRYSFAGTALYGKAGAVQYGGESCYIDCAVASCQAAAPLVSGHDTARLGESVTKSGAATGTTAGVVVSVDYADVAWIEGRPLAASRQLLVRSLDERPFCGAGDSGALVVNAAGNAVGLLWGVNSRGEGVACPIAPVLHAMNITLQAAVS